MTWARAARVGWVASVVRAVREEAVAVVAVAEPAVAVGRSAVAVAHRVPTAATELTERPAPTALTATGDPTGPSVIPTRRPTRNPTPRPTPRPVVSSGCAPVQSE